MCQVCDINSKQSYSEGAKRRQLLRTMEQSTREEVMMVKDSEDLPPPYTALVQSSAESAEESDTAPVDSNTSNPANSFENKNARVIFIQKVLSIFLMQTVAVDLVLEIFFYIRIFHRNFKPVGLLSGSIALYMISIAVLIKYYQSLHKVPFNYAVLVYQPIAVSIISVLLLRAVLDLNIMGEQILEMITLAWKACIFSTPVILLYSVFCLDSQHEIKLTNCILITTAVFGVTSLCIMPYANKISCGPVAVFWTIAVFYPIYLYILYDIVAMTKPDYHETITPTDYVNGAVNLSFDFFLIIKNFIITRICCCCCMDREPSVPEVIV